MPAGAIQALRHAAASLQERPGAVREALALRRQAMLLVARHLAEGAGVAVRQEHRIVAEACGSTRRPHQRALRPFPRIPRGARPARRRRVPTRTAPAAAPGDRRRGRAASIRWFPWRARNSCRHRPSVPSGCRARRRAHRRPARSCRRTPADSRVPAAAVRLDAGIVVESSRRFLPVRQGRARQQETASMP